MSNREDPRVGSHFGEMSQTSAELISIAIFSIALGISTENGPMSLVYGKIDQDAKNVLVRA